MPTVQLKHSFGLHGAPGAPKGRLKWDPTRLSPKYTLYGINQFVSMHTLHLQHSLGEPTLMEPPGAPSSPNGHPKWGPHPTSTEIHLVWYQSTRLDSYSSFTTFLWRTDHHGAPGAPNGATTRLSPESMYDINGFSLRLQHSLG